MSYSMYMHKTEDYSLYSAAEQESKTFAFALYQKVIVVEY